MYLELPRSVVFCLPGWTLKVDSQNHCRLLSLAVAGACAGHILNAMRARGIREVEPGDGG